MPLTLSFPGQLHQTEWWQPAVGGALHLSEMLESHRQNTYHFLLRQAKGIDRAYRETLAANAAIFYGGGSTEAAPRTLEEHKAHVELVGPEAWLRSTELMEALLAQPEDSPVKPLAQARCLELTPIFALQDAYTVDAAKFPHLLLQSPHLRLRVTVGSSGLCWGFREAPLTEAFPHDEVATVLTAEGLGDPLSAHLLAVELEAVLESELATHLGILARWPSEFDDDYGLRRYCWAAAEERETPFAVRLEAGHCERVA